MSRTGPGYVTSESEMRADIRRKLENHEISDQTADAFFDLFEFAQAIGDKVAIGGAKNANFQLKVDAHRGNYQRTSVFTANVNGKVKVWPARAPLSDEANREVISWSDEDYARYERQFRSLRGVPSGANEVSFKTLVEHGQLDRFKEIVEAFVATCRQ